MINITDENLNHTREVVYHLNVGSRFKLDGEEYMKAYDESSPCRYDIVIELSTGKCYYYSEALVGKKELIVND